MPKQMSHSHALQHSLIALSLCDFVRLDGCIPLTANIQRILPLFLTIELRAQCLHIQMLLHSDIREQWLESHESGFQRLLMEQFALHRWMITVVASETRMLSSFVDPHQLTKQAYLARMKTIMSGIRQMVQAIQIAFRQTRPIKQLKALLS
jgi:hypothetical protein